MMDVTTGAAIAPADPRPSAAAIPHRSILDVSRILIPPTVSLKLKTRTSTQLMRFVVMKKRGEIMSGKYWTWRMRNEDA
jgi:hypothetical protein